MAETDYDWAALTFANQWQSSEATVFDGLHARSPRTRLAALNAGAKHFRIARNFPRRFDSLARLERLAPAFEALEEFRGGRITRESVVGAVEGLAGQFAKRYGGRRLISAASKCLWLLHRSPVVIYDSQARRALGVPAGDYAKYVWAWRARYKRDEARIHNAAARLQETLMDNAMGELWFRERILDLCLWREGKRS